MPKPLTPHSTNELTYYFMVTPCDACGSGPQTVTTIEGGKTARVTARCERCGHEHAAEFRSEFEPSDPQTPCVNPLDEPSRLVDLNQWLGVAYVLIDQITENRGADAHALQLQAAVCLTEALKFYDPDDEVPPVDAFFHETSQRAFREHPETFARQHVCDLLAKLPPMPAWPGDA